MSYEMGWVLSQADADILSQQAYDCMRADRWSDLPNHVLARQGICTLVAPIITIGLNQQLQREGVELAATSEQHAVSHPTYIQHHYTSLPNASGDPMLDIVLDGTFKQFLNLSSPLHVSAPHCFVGPRKQIFELMQKHVPGDSIPQLYLPVTLQEQYLLRPAS
jgi:hypothetical protein